MYVCIFMYRCMCLCIQVYKYFCIFILHFIFTYVTVFLPICICIHILLFLINSLAFCYEYFRPISCIAICVQLPFYVCPSLFIVIVLFYDCLNFYPFFMARNKLFKFVLTS